MSTFSCQTLVSKYLFTTKETRSPWENSWLQAWEGEDRKSTGEPVVLCHARRGACSLSHFSARLFATPRTLAHQAPLSKGFSWQEKWSGLPFPPSGDLPHPGIQPVSPALQENSLLLSHQGIPRASRVLKESWKLSPMGQIFNNLSKINDFNKIIIHKSWNNNNLWVHTDTDKWMAYKGKWGHSSQVEAG